MNTLLPNLRKRQRGLPLAALAMVATLISTLVTPQQAQAFGGEDPLNGAPWHHEDITKKAAKACEWTDGAAEALAWHADYIDSYLYNPLWWAKGGVHRLKSSLATGPELEKLHFDDNFSRDRVDHAWRRYLSGTIAGLVWARENNDVSAAQNIVGVSLHAIQDFYSHSNWVDAPDRRTITYFNASLLTRQNMVLYTGTYEKGDHEGVKHHGKIAPMATVFKLPGVETLMDIAASPLSPLQNTSLVQQYKAVKDGVPIQPYIPFTRDEVADTGWKVPNNVVYLSPPGIALDNSWSAVVGVQQRGLTDLTGRQAFDIAKNLAIQCSTQWLKRIEAAMSKNEENKAFWKLVKETPTDQNTREREFENFSKFPYTFLSAGKYPVQLPGKGDEYFLRIKLKTSNAAFAGTNADVRLKVGNENTLLDYLPRGLPLVADDFEAGDTRVYVAGPYSALPTSIALHNDSPNFKGIVKALGVSLSKLGESIGGLFLNIIGGHADHVGTNKKIWTPEALAEVTTAGKPFDIEIDGKNEGQYRISGRITRVLEGGEGTDAWAQYKIVLERLHCIKESKNDRGSNSDEPFLLTLLSSWPGDTTRYRTAPFKDVDKGESPAINYTFTSGRIPKQYGMINLPICVMESDDETETMRRKLLDAFAGKIEDETAADKRTFLTALDSARAADWKLEHIEVYAWTRNGSIRAGKVCDNPYNRWIEGGDTATFTLDAKGLNNTEITTDELLVAEGTPGTSEPAPSPTPSPTPTPGPGNNNPPPSGVSLNALIGKWQTSTGSVLTVTEAVTTAGTPATLYATAKKGGFSLENFYLRVEDGVIQGLWQSRPGVNMATEWGAFGIVKITMAPGGDSFTGNVVLKNGNQITYNGTRIKDSEPGSDTGTGNTGNGNTGTVPPSGGRGVGKVGDGKFRALDKFDVRFDEIKPGRAGTTLELFATFRNTSSRAEGITAGTFDPILIDPDGVIIKDHGNLYRASGQNPERFGQTVTVEPDGQAKVRYVFDMPAHVSKLKTLQIIEYRSRPVLIDIADTVVPGTEDAPAAPKLPEGIVPLSNAKFVGIDDLDVRVDGVRKGRDGKTLELFITVKNPTEKMGELSASTLDMTVTDEDGVGTRRVGNLYLATGDRPEYLNRNILIAPGGQGQARYLFELATPTVKQVKLTIKGYKPPVRTFNLPDLPENP